MRESTAERYARVIVLSLLSLFVLVPLFAMVSSAVKPLRDVQGSFTWLPTHPTVQAFVDMWTTVPLGRYLMNSLVVSSLAAVVSVAVAIFAAFAVSRYRFRGRTLFSLTFSIWMLVGYLGAIPRGLDEAAQVDGAGPLRTLFRIILPVALPGVIAVTVYAFMTAWGEVLFASVMTDQATRTVAIGLQGYSTQFLVYWNQVMAASLVVSIPIVAGFLFLQRYFIAGLTAGSVK